MKIRPVGAEVFSVDIRTDRQIDMTEIIVAFRNIARLKGMPLFSKSKINLERKNLLKMRYY